MSTYNKTGLRRLLIFCLSVITVLASINASLQTDEAGPNLTESSALKLFPLRIGDKRIYRFESHSSTYHEYNTYISEITDTVRIGGKKYYKENSYFYYGGQPAVKYYRLDTANGNLLMSSGTGCSYYGGEEIVDTLAAALNDTVKTCGVYNPYNRKFCILVDSITLFETRIRTKKFERFGVSNGNDKQYTEKFGLYRHTGGGIALETGYSYKFELKGGIIDGRMYGDTTLTSLNAISSNTPDNFELAQNYPNPFNPSTVIKFALPKSESVSLVIYDAAGREMLALINNKRLETGVYSTGFNGSSFPTGVYFYRLTAGSYTGTKKMLLVK